MQLVLTLFFSFILCSEAATSSLPLDDQGDDCCQLKWLRLIERRNKRFIPSSAISRTSENGTRWFYFMKPGDWKIGAISDEVERPVVFLEAAKDGPWTGGYVLSNPRNCVTSFIHIERGQEMRETVGRQFPSFNGSFFIGVKEVIGYCYNSGNNKYNGGELRFDSGYVRRYTGKTDFFPSFNVLTVECQASLKNDLTAELFHMDIDMKKLKARQEHEKVAMTEIFNESDNERIANVDLKGHINSALEITHETNLNTVATTKWAVNGSCELNFIGGLISLAVQQADQEKQDLKEEFTRSGSIRSESKNTIYRFNQLVDMEPHTRTKVVIKTKNIIGREKFKAHYRLSSKKPGMSNNEILRSLERIGFPDVDRIKAVKDELVLIYDGEISVDKSYDTHVLIEAHSTAGSELSPLEFV